MKGKNLVSNIFLNSYQKATALKISSMLLAEIGRPTYYYHIMLEDFMRELSNIEHKIMYLLSKWNCPKKISEKLHISYGTIRWHLSNLRRLYNVHTTRELLFTHTASYTTTYSNLKISPRSKLVIELFIQGKTYEQIAYYLGISVSGVRRHLEKCLIQNDCKSTIELLVRYKNYYKI